MGGLMTTNVVAVPRGRRLAVATAITGTVFIAVGAFWLSFTALADLARRSGIDGGQAWAWPLIVDGIIVVATVAVVALAGQRRPTLYPWTLLAAGAVVSVTANAIHAIVAADADVPPVLAASVAAIPPLVLLSITHLTVILTRPTTAPTVNAREEEPSQTASVTERDAIPERELAPEPELPVALVPVSARRAEAGQLRSVEGWSNKRIARHLGVHPSTVGRWFTPSIGEAKEETP